MDHHKLNHLRKLSRLMDSQFTGPFGIKFGLDGLLGLIPVVGDLSTGIVSIYIILQAAQSGCRPMTLLRMGLNVILDNALVSIPILGNLADFFWRSNDRNIELLERHMQAPTQTSRQSAVLLLGILVFVLGALVLSIYVSVQLIRTLVVYLQSFGPHS